MDLLNLKPIKMNDYKKILELCVSNDDLRAWMQKPFMIEDKIMSTNGHILCIVPYKLIGEHYYLHTTPNNILSVIPTPSENRLLTITKAELRELMSLCPMVDDYEEVGQDKDCEACDGFGDVDFEFYYEGKNYYSNSECPICQGEGLTEKVVRKPNGKKVIDTESIVEIMQSWFRMETISVLNQVCQILDSDALLISQEKDMSANLFQIGEVRLLIMPIYKDVSNKNPFYSKK